MGSYVTIGSLISDESNACTNTCLLDVFIALLMMMFQMQSRHHWQKDMTTKILSQVTYFIFDYACDYTTVIDKDCSDKYYRNLN